MWKLSKLEIRGFKSFAEPAELDFPEGITAVVGPNGCGKSNISDAILWVLGEQSTRALRAQRMQDVIFQGSSSRRATPFAEVTLRLSNGDGNGHLAAAGGNGHGNGAPAAGPGNGDSASAAGPGNGGGPASEASGNGTASTASSNGTASATAGNGAGHDGADPEQDGAAGPGDGVADPRVGTNGGNGAGVTVSDTGDTVITAGDVTITATADVEVETLDDIDPSDDPTESMEAELAARTDGALAITRRLYRSGDSEYLLDGGRCRLRDIRERLAGTGLGARACFTIGQGQIDQILSASPTERRAPLEEAAGITLYRHRRHLTELKLEATAQDLARVDDICEEVARQVRSLKRQAGRARRYKKLRARLRELERTWLAAAYTEARQGREHAEAGSAGARAVEAAARARLEEAGRALSVARQELQAGRAAEQQRRQGLYQGQLRHERLQSEARRQEDRLAFAEERLSELRRRLAELEERVDEADALRQRRDEAATESEAAAGAARQALEEAEERLEAAERRAAGRVATEESGPDEVEDGRPLAAHLTVEEKDHAALVLTLGDLLEVPVQGEDDVAGWLSGVLDGATAARTLWAAGRGPIASPPPADSRLAGALRERMETRSGAAAAVMAHLLADTWVVRRPADAPVLAREYPGHAFVDESGSCWACGVEVRARGRQVELTEFEDTREAAAEAPGAEAGVKEQAPPATPEVLACREVRERSRTARRAAESEAQARRQELAVATAARRRLGVEIDRTGAEIRELQEAAAASRRHAETAREEAARAAEECRRLEAELADTEHDDHAGEARVAGLEAAQAEAREQLEAAHDARSRWEVRAAEVRANCNHLESQIRERLGVEPEEVFQRTVGDADEADDDVTDDDGEEAEAATSAARGAAGQAGEAGPAAGATAGDGSRAGEGRGGAADEEALDLRAVRAEIREVQEAIDRLGPVNLVAYEELQEQQERHTDLDGQRRDLRDASDNLQEAIRRIDEDCVGRFEEAFESINGYFNRIFRSLFAGGRAGMRLEDPEDPLDTGIEIFAQPPGKKLQNIRLLSGGERTLVALSLLFAIFEYRPSAFCILDEADAALDEANVDRFVRALHDFEDRTQFILITHNKRTMEVADLLYGVTMQESGVSKLVSVQLG